MSSSYFLSGFSDIFQPFKYTRWKDLRVPGFISGYSLAVGAAGYALSGNNDVFGATAFASTVFPAFYYVFNKIFSFPDYDDFVDFTENKFDRTYEIKHPSHSVASYLFSTSIFAGSLLAVDLFNDVSGRFAETFSEFSTVLKYSDSALSNSGVWTRVSSDLQQLGFLAAASNIFISKISLFVSDFLARLDDFPKYYSSAKRGVSLFFGDDKKQNYNSHLFYTYADYYQKKKNSLALSHHLIEGLYQDNRDSFPKLSSGKTLLEYLIKADDKGDIFGALAYSLYYSQLDISDEDTRLANDLAAYYFDKSLSQSREERDPAKLSVLALHAEQSGKQELSDKLWDDITHILDEKDVVSVDFAPGTKGVK
ncbi:MAG: hypothetical protein ACQESE_04945, partial [Nanobdellota archaeon]